MGLEARDIMVRNVITLSPGLLVAEASGLLLRHRIHGAPVVDEAGHPIGMVSFVDFAAQAGERVRDIMVPDPVWASPDTPIEKIAAVMLEQMVRRVVIVEGGRVVGIVSASDIIHLFLNLHEQVQTLRRKLAGEPVEGEVIDR